MVKNMSGDVRWKQRFQNFDRAYKLLSDALKQGPGALNALEKDGVLRRFKYSVELAWKTLKDLLEYGGLNISPGTPHQVIKEAFAAKILSDGQVWIDMLNHGKFLSHYYDETVRKQTIDAISVRYLPELEGLHRYLERFQK